MIHSPSSDSRRVWWAVAWLVLGVGCGLFVVRGSPAVDAGGKPDESKRRGKVSSIMRPRQNFPTRRWERAADPRVSVTPKQLELTAGGDGRFDHLIDDAAKARFLSR